MIKLEDLKDSLLFKRIVAGSILLVLFTLSLFLASNSKEGERRAIAQLETAYNQLKRRPIAHDPFRDIPLKAKSAIVWDIKNKKALFERNADTILPLASIAKILLAAVSLDVLSPNTQIKIESEFLDAEGDTGLLPEEQWLLKDLLNFSLIESSNDGARAIASVAGAKTIGSTDYTKGREEFIRLMNKKAKSWGMTHIVILDETGLDSEDKTQSGAYGTAREVAALFESLLTKYPEVIESTKESALTLRSLSNIEHSAVNTNQTVSLIPGILASKTGYTDLAGGNLAIVFDPSLGRPIVAVVLGSTFEDRFSDIEHLVEATRAYIIQEKILRINTNEIE